MDSDEKPADKPYRTDQGLSHPPQEYVERGVGHHVCPDCCKRACLCGGRSCPYCGYDGGYEKPIDGWRKAH